MLNLLTKGERGDLGDLEDAGEMTCSVDSLPRFGRGLSLSAPKRFGSG